MTASKLGRAWALPFCVLGATVAINCSDTESPGPNNGGGSAGTPGASGSSSGSSGASTTGGSASGSAGTSGGGSSSGGANTTAGAAGTAGAAAGTAGSGGAGGGAGGAGGGAGGAGGSGGSVSAGFTPCSTEPAETAPALKRGAVINGFTGMQTAGQIVGVPGVANLLYVIGHRNGDVHIVKDGTVQANPLVHVNVANGGNNEQGLLSMALHPNFATNHLFYLFYTATNGAMTIDEFERTSETAATMKRNIYSRARSGDGAFHNGGSISFNPKDASPFLYFSVGNNSSNEAGDPNAFSGRVLKITPETKDIAQFGYGLRNPYRMSIDRLTGDMYVGDAANGAGGTVIYQANGKAGVTDWLYRNNNGNPDVNNGVQRETTGGAIIGGFVYRGNKIPGLCGRYFYGLYQGGTIKSIVIKNGQKVGNSVTHGTLAVPGDLTSFGEDGEGELYMASMNNAIYKIEAM